MSLQDLFADGPAPTRAQAAAAERSRALAEDQRREQVQRERRYINALRLGYRDRAEDLKFVANKLATMPDGDPNSPAMVVLLHDLIAEVRSYDRAILQNPDDWVKYEKAVPLGLVRRQKDDATRNID